MSDFRSALNKTKKVVKKPRWWVSPWWGGSPRWVGSKRPIYNGGRISNWFFKRRAKKTCELILSTCYLYRIVDKDPENLKIVDSVIQDVTRHMNELNELEGEQKKTATEKIVALTPVISVITGIVGLTIFSTLLKYIEEGLKNMGSIQYETIILIFPIVMLVLEFPLLLILFQYRWYRDVMRIMDVNKTEETVFKSLYPLELKITDITFPKKGK